MSGIDNIKSSNEKYVLLRHRYDYCQCCMLGEFSECEGLVSLDGCAYCETHGKWLKPTAMRVNI